MTLDGPFDDGTGDRRPERQLRSCPADADQAGARAEPAEPRTRAEYYEVLRAAEKKTVQADERPEDKRAEGSGWDAIDAENGPAPETIYISPDRSTHILDGDAYGGGHRHGTGKPGKTEFPASWDDQKVIHAALDIARKPDQPPVHQDRNNRWLCVGTRDGVEVSVIVLPGGDVWTAWPDEGSPGVVRNPRKGTS
jgi:Bacterial EndoU nuclease